MGKIKTAVLLLVKPRRFFQVIYEKFFYRSVSLRQKWAKINREKFYGSIRARIIFRYLQIMGSVPNLEKPSKYSEKIQWRKLYCPGIGLISQVTDKAKVYEYVKPKIGEQHLLPIIWAKSSVTPEDILHLGDNVVLQPTHRSGQVVFIEKQNEVDQKVIADRLNLMLKWPYSIQGQEPWYAYAKPQVIARPLVKNSDGSPYLNDCKIHVFRGKVGEGPKLICEIINTYPHWRAIFDEHFNRLEFEWSPDIYPPPDFEVKKPVNFDEMVRDAKSLSEPFDYVRVDFMIGAQEYYFTELTFAPAGGMPKMSPEIWDEIVGSYWNLDIGNWIKRRFWFLRAWMPLWRFERPARLFRRMHRFSPEIYLSGIRPEEYLKEYQRKESGFKIGVLTPAVNTIGTLASTNYYANLINGLRKNGIDAFCIAYAQNERPNIAGSLLGGNLVLAPFNTKDFDLCHVLSNECPGVVICHNSREAIESLLKCSKNHGTKYFLFSGESPDAKSFSDDELENYYSLVRSNFDGIITMTNQISKKWEGAGWSKEEIFSVTSFVDVAKCEEIKPSQEKYCATYFGNVAHGEVSDLLSASAKIVDLCPDFRLDMFTDSPQAAVLAYQQSINEAGLSGTIMLHGPVSWKEMISIEKASKILLFPGRKSVRSENGFPNKLGEYLASGGLVIASCVGGIKNLFVDGEELLFVSPYDIDDFTTKVVDVLSHPEKYEYLRANALRWATEKVDATNNAALLMDWALDNGKTR